MQHQPLAFTLVKTVVTARDEARELSPPLATAWRMMAAELSPAHRVMSEEVNWNPAQQADLRFVIDGVRQQFDADPRLAEEVLAFLSEVETYADEEEVRSAMLAIGIGASASSGAQHTEGTSLSGSFPEPDIAQSLPTAGSRPITQSGVEADSIEDDVVSSSTAPESGSTTVTAAGGGSLPAVSLALAVALGVTYLIWARSANEATDPPPLDLKAYFEDSTDEVSAATFANLGYDYAEPLANRPDYTDFERDARKLELELSSTAYPTPVAKTERILELGNLLRGASRHGEAAGAYLRALERQYANATTDRIALGRTHLLLARAYADAGRRVLSLAHLRQARHYFDQEQEIVAPSDLERLRDVEAQIGT